jgi:hypothetical protein
MITIRNKTGSCPGLKVRVMEMMISAVSTRRVTVGACVAFLALLVGAALYMMAPNRGPLRNEAAFHPLPSDVESFVSGYRLNQNFPGGFFRLTGKHFVRRGQKFFAVRSTLLKKNFFDDVSGSYVDRRNKVEFTAGKLEWEIALDKTLLLHDVGRLAVNDANFEHIETAEINFGKRCVTIYDGGARTYALK